MRFQEFFDMTPEEQCVYIASEVYVREKRLEAFENANNRQSSANLRIIK